MYVRPIRVSTIPPNIGDITPIFLDILFPNFSPKYVIIPAVIENIIDDVYILLVIAFNDIPTEKLSRDTASENMKSSIIFSIFFLVSSFFIHIFMPINISIILTIMFGLIFIICIIIFPIKLPNNGIIK